VTSTRWLLGATIRRATRPPARMGWLQDQRVAEGESGDRSSTVRFGFFDSRIPHCPRVEAIETATLAPDHVRPLFFPAATNVTFNHVESGDMPVPPPAVHRTIIAVDVEGFGDRCRTNSHQVAVRDGLYRVLRQAFRAATIPWAGCHHEDRGDGVLILAPPEVAKSVFVESLPDQLVEGLREHNSAHPAPEHIRLRMALHAGELHYDDHGVTGASVNLTFRLLDAGPLKSALAESPGVLAWIFHRGDGLVS